MGRQAGGSVVARMQDTIVYSTVCNERESTPVDFTPLRVDWFARYRYDTTSLFFYVEACRPTCVTYIFGF